MRKQVYLKTAEEIACMRLAADLTSRTLGMLASEIAVGVSPLRLDALAEAFIRDHGARPGFLGQYGFPNTLCVSRNEAVVHGIPTKKPLETGELLSIDCGVLLDGFYGDQAYTFAVGEIDPLHQQLLDVTQEALAAGIAAMQPGGRIGDIGHAIASVVKPHGYGIVRELVGHGLGRRMHEGPDVPNYGRRGHGPRIDEGLVIAIEPMINLGTERVRIAQDGWTVRTADGKVSAHFEHNVAFSGGKAEVLTSFDYIKAASVPG